MVFIGCLSLFPHLSSTPSQVFNKRDIGEVSRYVKSSAFHNETYEKGAPLSVKNCIEKSKGVNLGAELSQYKIFVEYSSFPAQMGPVLVSEVKASAFFLFTVILLYNHLFGLD